MNAEAGAVLAVTLVGVAVGAVLVWGLLKASTRPDPALVVTSLSLLTFVALVAYAVTEYEILGGLAATGFGALAGAVTGLFKQEGRRDEVDGKVDEGG